MNTIQLFDPNWLTEAYWAGEVYVIVDQHSNVWVARKDWQI